MKQLLFIFLATVLGAAGIKAQRHADHPRMNRLEKLDSVVNLTDAQKEELKAINDNFKVEVREARKTEDRAKLRTIHEEHKRSVSDVLTEEQKTLLKQHRVEQREKHKAFKEEVKTYRQNNIKPVLEQARKDFDANLSDEEKGKIAVLRTQLQEQHKAAHKGKCGATCHKEGPGSGKSCCAEGKEGNASMTKEKVHAELQTIVDAHKSELAQVEASLKDKRKEWKTDIEAIQAKHGVNPPDHKRKGNGKRHHAKEGMDHKKGFAYRFLLINT